MKVFFIVFGVFCAIATFVMIKVTHDGVSIRSAPIISPSPQGDAGKNISVAVVTRLFPDFQNASYVTIGSPTDMDLGVQVINDLKSTYEGQFKKNVTLLKDDGQLSLEKIAQCAIPCWILTSETQAHELSNQNPIPQILNTLQGIEHFSLTLIPFSNVPETTEECVAEKRLSLHCIIPLSIHQVRKKFKDPAVAYFFMRKYQDRDYFLFIQTGQLR
ncbi:MAG: hypothetical protein HUU57_12245 [Bdellovibrio sp.]|nr:hypothetical protein [Bdellovibrio sp.]